MRRSFLAAAAVLAIGFMGAASQATEFRTTQCAKYGQPEIVFEVKSAAIPEADSRLLIETLEQMVAGGSRFKAGETLQLGWMTNRFEQGADGTLRLQEPDLQRFPMRFVDQMDATLQHNRAQKDAVESFTEKVPLMFPSLRESVFVPPLYALKQEFSLERHPPAEGDSGWIMTPVGRQPTDEEVERYRRVSLYEFAMAKPSMIPVLALPAGTVIDVPRGGDERAYSVDGRTLTVRADSYLQKFDAKQRLQAYHHALSIHVLEFWEIPKNAPEGMRCTAVLKLSPRGEVKGVEFASCPDDAQVRKSIQNAVRKASPVPPPKNPADYLEAVRIMFGTTYS